MTEEMATWQMASLLQDGSLAGARTTISHEGAVDEESDDMAVAALMVALLAGTAEAKQNGKNGATFNLKGTLQEVAADDSYVVVDVTGGNCHARDHHGIQQFGVPLDIKIEVNGEEANLSALW